MAPARFQQKSRNVPGSFQHKSHNVPGRFRQRSSTGSKKVPGRFQHSSNNLPTTIKQGACKVARKVPSKVPGRFQQGSRAVPVFRACIFVAPVPGPRDYNPTDSLLGINTYLNSYGSCPLFVASIYHIREGQEPYIYNRFAVGSTIGDPT